MQAFFLVGFGSWGKTYHCQALFGQKRFRTDATYTIPGVHGSFTVQQNSNDDMREAKYLSELNTRLTRTSDRSCHLFAALCPTAGSENDIRRILSSDVLIGMQDRHLLYLKYKWDHHAELRIPQIIEHLRGLDRVVPHIIDADDSVADVLARGRARTSQIIRILRDRLAGPTEAQ